jgi:hypothetical protein
MKQLIINRIQSRDNFILEFDPQVGLKLCRGYMAVDNIETILFEGTKEFFIQSTLGGIVIEPQSSYQGLQRFEITSQGEIFWVLATSASADFDP